MKKLFSLGLVAMLALTAVISSCSKYEEGSNFSLISAKGRVAGDWKLSSYTINGTDYTSSMGTINVTFDKDGTYTGTATYVVLGASFTDSYSGTWAFNNDKTALLLTATGSATVDTQTIVMLKSKMMKLKSTDTAGGVTILTIEQQ